MRIFGVIAATALAASLAGPAAAGGYRTVEWSELQSRIYGDRQVEPAEGAVTIEAPVRAEDDRRVPVAIDVRLFDGSAIRSVSLIIDENPMPLSAKIDLDAPRDAFSFAADMRLNGPSPVRAVVETDDGRLLMAETFVKTSGLGACAAPPIGDPTEAIAAIGEMEATETAHADGATALRRVRVDMSHPQHTGMQMNQITLHYILARYVHEVDVWAGEEKLFRMTGSISLSEDPAFEFDFPDNGARTLRVRMADTEDTVVDRTMLLGPQS